MSDNIQNTEIKELLQSYVKNTFQFSKNDPLATVFSAGIIEITTNSIRIDQSWEKLNRTVNSFQKEFGINPLCISSGIVSLTWKEINYAIPLFLQEVKLNLNRLTGEVLLEISDENHINPFLSWFFEREFSIDLKENDEEIIEQLSTLPSIKIDENKQFIGNFHPHRFEMLREIEQLMQCDSFSIGLNQILGVSEGENTISLPFSTNELVPTDPDQFEVLTKVRNENCVVQGPPGTGKSQVIVNLIGKILELKKSTLVVSEKRVALDVIHKKMNSIGLGGLCYTSTQHFSNTDFILELKKEWERLEIVAPIEPTFSPTNDLIQSQLQNTLNLLHQPNLANGKTILEFILEYESIRNQKNAGYSSELPSLEEWNKLKLCFNLIFKNDLQYLVSQLKTELLEKSFLVSLESKIQGWKKSVSELCQHDKSLNYSELFEIARKALSYSKFNTVIFKKYGSSFSGRPALLKKLTKLKKELTTLQIEAEKSKTENSHWLISPNKAEVTELIKRFENSSFFTVLSRKKEWKKWTRSPFLDPTTSLNLRLKQLDIQEKLQDIESELLKNGIEKTIDLEEILQLSKVVSGEEIQDLQSISEKEKRFFEEKQVVLASLLTDFKLYFRFDENTDLISYFDQLEKHLYLLLENSDTFLINSKSLSILCKKYNSVEEIEQAILHSTWSKLKIDFPLLLDFEWDSIYQKVDELLSINEKERQDFASFLLQKQKKQFDYFHELLVIPAQKLTEEKKELKQELKAGKRILVKEFAKSRNHLSIRQLMESPAKRWIQLLKPVWLMNPSRISACFPLEKNMFSLAIFDEASQIPLENAFGALQRSERIIIAGDPQQMSPSSYFSTATDSVDLLHQASFYLQSKFLSYHYRSYHPELISFSNKHFYQNRLTAFQHANYSEKPINFHYISNGRFENRVNSLEAKAVAEYLSSKISSTESLGIVAFSESQLQEILAFLPAKSTEILQERVDKDEIFFKSVENVQGDECDELIVSFGYGYSDEEDVFAHRFGPINLNSGSKRLNVLLTRARKKISFFASVNNNDFKQSSNESVEILRKWFRTLDDTSNDPNIDSCKIHVKDILRNNQNILAIKTLISVYKDRKWLINRL
ncbi:MAG: AAA domain-containing protein [Crocinitomicaceae bacterium]